MSAVNFARHVLANLGRVVRGRASEAEVSDINLFFATAALGGAERVHGDILKAITPSRATVYLCEKADESPLLDEYARYARVVDISGDTASRARFYMRVGSIAAAINAQPSPTVLGGNSYFFYRMIPFLKPHVRCMDLLHNFGGGLEQLGLLHARRLNQRVFINFRTLEDVKAQYAQHGLDSTLLERLMVIENACDVPAECPAKAAAPFCVLFVGRGSPEKRVHLAGRIARLVKSQRPDAEFVFIGGNVRECVAPEDRQSVTFTGAILNRDALHQHYARAHVLLLTSSMEGFPLVVMEAMAHGCVPICADVGGIAWRVRQDVSGFLLDARDEQALVDEGARRILGLADRLDLRQSMGAAARHTAERYFRHERFDAAWRALLLNEPWPEGYPVRFSPPVASGTPQ